MQYVARIRNYAGTMPLEKIAEDLVEEVSVIEPIYRTAEKFAPEYDAGLVFENMNGTI